MDKYELTALISQTAQLMEQFERRCDRTDETLQGLIREMQSLTRQLPQVVQQSANASLQALPPQLIQMVRGGLEQAAAGYQERLRASAGEVGSSTQTMAREINRMERLHRHLVWKTVGVTAICLLLLLGGGVWLSMHYTKIIRDNQLSAQLMQAYNRADVTLCDGKLCANVDAKSPRYGSRRQYIPVKPR